MGVFKEKDHLGRTRYVVSKYWPSGAGRLRIYCPNLASAKNLLARVDNAIVTNTWRDLRDELSGTNPDEANLKGFSERFIEERCKPRMRAWTDYARSLSYVGGFLRNLPIADLSRDHIHRYVKSRDGKVSAASINREVAAVKSMMTYAVDCGIVQMNPLLGFRMLREQKKTSYPLTTEEVDRLIACCEDQKLQSLVGLLSETGMRLQEAIDLRWMDLDFHTKILSVAKSKNYDVRLIPLSKKAIGFLLCLPKLVDFEWVFVSRGDLRYTCPRKGFLEAVRKAGLPKGLGFHDLRRYRALQWHRNGLEVRSISHLLGHADIATTLRYLGISRDLEKRVREVQEREAGETEEKEKPVPPGVKQE